MFFANTFKIHFFVLISFIAINACNSNINNKSEYLKWLNDEKNGFVKKKEINNFILSVKYLPNEYLVYQELTLSGKTKQKEIDSLKNYYSHTLSFIFTIENKDSLNTEDVLMYNVQSKKDFNIRSNILNFKISDFFNIKEQGREYAPLLCNFEASYGYGGKRKIYLVFPNINSESENITIIFRDEIFETGISHFIFEKKKINNVPKITFWK